MDFCAGVAMVEEEGEGKAATLLLLRTLRKTGVAKLQAGSAGGLAITCRAS